MLSKRTTAAFGAGRWVITVLVLIGLALGLVIAHEILHPCVEYVNSTCESTVCAAYMTTQVGDVSMLTCAYYETEQYDYQRCVRRKP